MSLRFLPSEATPLISCPGVLQFARVLPGTLGQLSEGFIRGVASDGKNRRDITEMAYGNDILKRIVGYLLANDRHDYEWCIGYGEEGVAGFLAPYHIIC